MKVALPGKLTNSEKRSFYPTP